ncbi:MAG: NPCBM/NEW2 domain-containing protein [Acidobacteria bacterium]|nr:NPCBM/NEW2 domain-containing protein [Acidobacteriota bacterium]
MERPIQTISFISVRRALFLLLLIAGLAIPAAAQDRLPGFIDEVATSGLDVPVAFAPLPDGRILVAEKGGVVRIIANGVVQPEAFLDIRDRVNDYWDRGLLGIAVDPAFDTNRFVYLFYVHEDDPFLYAGPKTSRLVRVTAGSDTANPASLTVILGGEGTAPCGDLPVGADCIPADGPSHNGGALRFDEAGALWVAIGDASTFAAVDTRALRSQSLDSLAGKLLRLTRTGEGWPGNPFWTGNAGDLRSKIWAYGFRNPFRFTFRPATGRPFVGDVGASVWEEINAVRPGQNFGWPCYEGPAPNAGFQPLETCQALYAQGPGAVTNALTGYAHPGDTASITGGTFYTGTGFPPAYQGAYVFGDYARNTLQVTTLNADDTVAGPIRGFAVNANGPVDIQVRDGMIWYLAINTGELRRIRYVADTGPQVTYFLGDSPMAWTFATNGAGAVKVDRSHGTGSPYDGGPITLSETPFTKGLGVRAPSDIRFALDGRCSTFAATIGIDDETKGAGSVVFEVWLDGTRVASSGVFHGTTPPFTGELDITGRQELRLVVTDAGDGSVGDHADWAGARVVCTTPGGDSQPPVVTAVTPVDGATHVDVRPTIVAGFSEALASSTVTTTTVQLRRNDTQQLVPSTVVYDAASRDVRLTPTANLQPATTYRMSIASGASGVKDLAGNALAQTASWTFTTSDPSTNAAPVPVIVTPAPGRLFRVDDLVTFNGRATDAEDGVIGAAGLRWSVTIRHCPGGVCHTHPFVNATGPSGSLRAPDHGDDSFLVFTLTATDSDGVSASTFVEVHPDMVEITLQSTPPGLQVVYGDVRRLTPVSFRAVIGGQISLAAPTPQHTLEFVRWSHGAPRQHTLTVGAAPATYTAVFSPPTGVSYLSDLEWTSATNGFGPIERDRSIGEDAPGDGGIISLNGITYAKGLGMAAPADLRIHLNGACTTFSTTVGLDDSRFGGGRVTVEVWVDGMPRVRSGIIDGLSPPISGTLDITGANELRLVVTDGGDGQADDAVDWADARVTCSGPGAARPVTPASFTALANGTLVGLSWSPVPGATSYQLEVGSVEGAADLLVMNAGAATGFSTVAPAGTYWLRVRANNAWGQSEPTADRRLVVGAQAVPPGAPEGLTASLENSTVTLQWSAPASGGLPTAYVVEAGASPGSLTAVLQTTTQGVAVANVAPGTYYVRVRAINAAGNGPPSAIVTVVVP